MRNLQNHEVQCSEHSHFHKVSESVALEVVKFLQRLLVARMENRINLPLDVCDTLWQFLDEFQYAYRHPRRDSHFALLNLSRNPSHVKNLSHGK